MSFTSTAPHLDKPVSMDHQPNVTGKHSCLKGEPWVIDHCIRFIKRIIWCYSKDRTLWYQLLDYMAIYAPVHKNPLHRDKDLPDMIICALDNPINSGFKVSWVWYWQPLLENQRGACACQISARSPWVADDSLIIQALPATGAESTLWQKWLKGRYGFFLR